MKIFRKIYRKIFKKQVSQESFWSIQHPIKILDKNSNAEDPMEEFRMVRNLLRNDRKRDYPDSNIEFGDFTYGNPKIWNFNKNINFKIGKYCSIAFGTTILIGGAHNTNYISTYPFSAFVNFFNEDKMVIEGDITIGNDVWIGSDVKILSDVTIGDGAVVGANSLILKGTNIPDYTIWAGVPAKQIKKRFSDDDIKKLQEIKWWNWKDEDIIKIIPVLQSDNIESLIEYYGRNIK